MIYTKIKKRPAISEISVSIYFSQRKKKRGLKRLIKPIELWRETNLNLDINELSNKKNQYIKLSFSSFFNFFKNHKPPLWYQRLLLKALFDIYKSWFVELSNLHKPFYLKIWLMKDDFLLSQIVLGIDEDIDIYPSIFNESPIHQHTSLGKLLNEFPFLDTMFIVPLMHLSSVNTIKDNLSQKQIKKYESISTDIIKESDDSITFTYPLDTVLLCSL